MEHNVKVWHGAARHLLFCGTLLAALSLMPAAKADTCTEIQGGTCKSHGECDTSDTKKHCLDTLKKDGYHCECRRGKNDRPHGSSHGPNINFGINLGIGDGGIGIDIGSGGYCDHWGCPGDYWDNPVFYGPVYFHGEWYEGPVYYRYEDGDYWYWVHGGWHRDEWSGDRPEWARETHRGPALGREYYKSDEFRHWHEHHARGDWDHDGDHEGDHHDGDHEGDHHDGDHWKDKDHHDKDGDGDKHKDKDKKKGKGCGPY